MGLMGPRNGVRPVQTGPDRSRLVQTRRSWQAGPVHDSGDHIQH